MTNYFMEGKMTEKVEEGKKENHELCIKAGATAGEIIRCVVDTVKKTGKAGEAVVKLGNKCSEKTAESCRNIRQKFRNLRKSAGYNKELAAWESRQKEVFLKIGEKIFKEKEYKQAETPAQVIEGKEVKALLDKAKSCEKEIQKIKDEMALEKQKAETLLILRRAENDLKSEDPRIRRVAVRVLERVASLVSKSEILPLISKTLDDPDFEVKERAAEIMHKLADKVKVKEKMSAKAEIPAEPVQKKAMPDEEKLKKQIPKTSEEPASMISERSAEMLHKMASKLKEKKSPDTEKKDEVIQKTTKPADKNIDKGGETSKKQKKD